MHRTFTKYELMKIVYSLKETTEPTVISITYRRNKNFPNQIYRTERSYIPPNDMYIFGSFKNKERYHGKIEIGEAIPENYFYDVARIPDHLEIHGISRYFSYGKPLPIDKITNPMRMNEKI